MLNKKKRKTVYRFPSDNRTQFARFCDPDTFVSEDSPSPFGRPPLFPPEPETPRQDEQTSF